MRIGLVLDFAQSDEAKRRELSAKIDFNQLMERATHGFYRGHHDGELTHRVETAGPEGDLYRRIVPAVAGMIVCETHPRVASIEMATIGWVCFEGTAEEIEATKR